MSDGSHPKHDTASEAVSASQRRTNELKVAALEKELSGAES